MIQNADLLNLAFENSFVISHWTYNKNKIPYISATENVVPDCDISAKSKYLEMFILI